MDANSFFQTVIDLLYWLMISASVGVPLMVSLYVVVTPAHKLSASWQNFRMSRQPHRALKDRHFKHLPRRIKLVKIACFFLFFVCLWAALRLFNIDMWGFLSSFSK